MIREMLDFLQSPDVGFIALGLAVLILLAVLWRLFWAMRRGSIRNRLLFAFVLVAVLPLFLTGIISSLVSASNLETQVKDQLESVATLKEAEIVTWTERLNQALGSTVSKADQTHLNTVFADLEMTPPIVFSYSHDQLLDSFQSSMERSRLFDELFLLNLDGQVVVSTLAKQEGKSFTGQPFFEEGSKEHFIAPPLYAPSLETFRIIVSQPVLNEQKVPIGVLAGRANLDILNEILLERTGLGRTGETYLVGADHVLVSVLRSGERYLTVRTAGANQAIASQANGSGRYQNPHGSVVIGVYHWLPELQVSLMAEQQRNEALTSIRTIIFINSAVVAASLLIAVVLALLVTRSIANPISQLVETTTQIASGNLNLKAKVQRSDEIGALSAAFNSMAGQLQNLIAGLEQRVADRTRELEQRSTQIQIAAEVARDINASTDLEQLLSQAVDLIRERFGFYHAGIFLVDGRGEYAVLRSASGTAGKKMLESEHKLKVGAQGIVGDAAASGEAHIALDVDSDFAHFKNPLLPDTRSEMALPLRMGGKVIGVLDVQSDQSQAYKEDDITILQTLADQLAIAIENARLIRRMNQTVRELEQAQRNYTLDSWQAFSQSAHHSLGFRYQHLEVVPVSEHRPEAQQALKKGQTLILTAHELAQQGEVDDSSALAVPIKLRDEVIGVLNLRFQGEDIPREMVTLIEEAANRLALVLENARLLQEAQRLALRERLAGEITAKVRASNDPQMILQTAVQELRQALGAGRAQVVVQAKHEADD
ncbi:MAG: GAF domain-containing protein [Anaerolineales bacterium]